MKFYVRAAIVVAATAALGLACGKKNKLEQATSFPDSLVAGEVVAIVNSDTIHSRDLKVLALISMVDSDDSLKSRSFNTMLLDQLIDRSVFVQEARTAGVTAPDSVVDKLMEQFTANFSAQLAGELGREGVGPADFRNAIKRDLVIRSYVQQKIEPAIEVSDADCRAYFEEHKEQYVGLDSVRARHIIMLTTTADTEKDKTDRMGFMQKIRGRILKGEKFERLAQMYSQDGAAERGGDLGYFARGSMVKEFEDVAFSLKKGEMSKVFETQFGLHLVQCVDKKAAAPPNYDLAKPRIEDRLKQQALGEDLQNRLKRSREAAIIVRNYDTGA